MSATSRYVIGLDLGTTNSAVAYVDTKGLAGDAPLAIEPFSIPQLVKAGEVAEEALLPSYLFIPGEGEFDTAQLALPWAKKRSYAVGKFARDHGAAVPTRLVSSAKSWLCHAGVDRKGPILPWSAEPDFPKISPVEAGQRILEHVRDAWNEGVSDKASRFENQDIVLTVPASFDAVARELTLEAARNAGLENVTLFEEPQAAFYAWIYQSGDQWRKQVRPGDVSLVVDVGGGTSDFSLIAVNEHDGDLTLERLAVGDHLLLGGDNMDLALAHLAAQQMKASGTKLDSAQMLALWHASRQAKEKLFENQKLDGVGVTVLGRGRKVVGGSLKTELKRELVEQSIVEGFFPKVKLGEAPLAQSSVGLQELGLPYVTDVAITKHLSSFVDRHRDEIGRVRGSATGPNVLLFNGGVFQAEVLRSRVRDVVSDWSGDGVRELSSAGLDRAVAIGAAYYGMVRRGRGVRIRGGVARAYYIGVESAMPAVPGMPRPIRAVCVLPQGTEEGSEITLPAREFGLVVGQEVEFRFLSSTHRKEDRVGAVIDDWEDDIQEMAPLKTTIESTHGSSAAGQQVPVRLHGKVTEVGTLELWCQARDSDERWKLEFNVREEE